MNDAGRGLAFVSRPALETPRLRLRLPEERDLDAFAAMYADGTTMRHIGEGKVLSRDETWRAIAGMLGHWALRGHGLWAVERRDGGEVIGRVGFIDPEGWPGFELGWLIARPHWSQGFATEAARAALAYGRTTLGRSRIISLIRPANAASIRVAEKIGFRIDGTVELRGAPALVYANAPA
jgi:RimJ/RimL family protein N-acetyltransferase